MTKLNGLIDLLMGLSRRRFNGEVIIKLAAGEVNKVTQTEVINPDQLK